MKIHSAAVFAVLSLASSSNAKSNIRKLDKKYDSKYPYGMDMSTVEKLISNAGASKYFEEVQTIGSITALIPEASDALASRAPIKDGESGDINFPHGNIKPIGTVGEYDEETGGMIVGVPDGLGAYLVDDKTVRVVVQSESYIPPMITWAPSYTFGESYPFYVNKGSASFTGSHVQYVDYYRKYLASFMESDYPASEIVKGFGELIEYAYNLKGEPVGPRTRTGGPTITGVHYSNTDVDGNNVLAGDPAVADWLMQSLCSAHMEERHNWGKGIGLEDRIFLTNEEWITIKDDAAGFVGLPAHAIDVETKSMYALGVFAQGGFEKIVEFNTGHEDYVAFSISGYNGAFNGAIKDTLVNNRNKYYTRSDGKDYVWTNNLHPARIYIGKKGYDEQGEKADDFLSRNGLRYGKIYGFAVDMSEDGPTGGMWRDAFHKDPKMARNGAKVNGEWLPTKWSWDGVVRDYIHDGGWEFQDYPPNRSSSSVMYWNAKGIDAGGCKTEHNTPDLRPGKYGFIQSSTCGYFGHYYVDNLKESLDAMMDGEDFPEMLFGEYYVYQGELPVVDQIELGGKGQYAPSTKYDARYNIYGDTTSPTVVSTFEDIDGFEIVQSGSNMYAIIQEDSGNLYGERMFITSPLEHDDDGVELTYYFIAMSGGKLNSRMMNNVGIPAGVNIDYVNAHEFSGIFDLSGLLYREGREFYLGEDDEGYKKHKAEALVDINDKYILLGLQAHNFYQGLISFFNDDRGGQWLVYKPSIPK